MVASVTAEFKVQCSRGFVSPGFVSPGSNVIGYFHTEFQLQFWSFDLWPDDSNRPFIPWDINYNQKSECSINSISA